MTLERLFLSDHFKMTGGCSEGSSQINHPKRGII
jgi:hypothetical protein